MDHLHTWPLTRETGSSVLFSTRLESPVLQFLVLVHKKYQLQELLKQGSLDSLCLGFLTCRTLIVRVDFSEEQERDYQDMIKHNFHICTKTISSVSYM